ncbi:MAG: ABC transporter ATP-binding protein [Acidobacteria bacterium]|nr:ABC transporter ATP-binding protein [Acidobacteriota bacterium]MCZ6661830.1 ABC transporter ATP-binding protein [Actinomycetota bacterium]
MLELRNVAVELGGKPILNGVSLSLGRGEIVAILGPSGSGKSTLLRAIAGLVPLEGGEILWDGVDIATVDVHQRGFGLMFQGYALFPHLDVAGNVGFGLAKEDREASVPASLSRVGLGGFEERRIEELSGGEKQRVALARTLAPDPKLVMLDEPLGALDRSLRDRLVSETRQLLEEREVTAIVVTHDRDEAAAMSDRLAIMREGSIVQIGILEEILAAPADDWVRDFVT